MEVLKIQSTHPQSQGPFVLINATDFDPKVHKEYTEKAEKPAKADKGEKAEKPAHGAAE